MAKAPGKSNARDNILTRRQNVRRRRKVAQAARGTAETEWSVLPALRFLQRAINLNSAVGARQSSVKFLMLNQKLCLVSSAIDNPFGEALWVNNRILTD